MSIKLGNTNISSILGSSGASSGTTDYTDLLNKPSINGITLAGNKTTADLGITIDTDDFYTKTETNSAINTAVATATQPKADKTYVDTQLALKVSTSDLNTALALKSDKSTTYTKTETNAEINSAISTKADVSYVNTALDSKASLSDVYDKEEIDTQLGALESSTTSALATKANQATTYTKTEVDTAINTAVSDKATISYVDEGLATKANQATTYTKTEVDEIISATGPSGDTLPVGSIIPYSGQTTPENWLLCDGREVSRSTYSQLFSIIGTIYGAGDESTTFNLPDLKGNVTVGLDSNDTAFDTLGETGGEKTHTLTIDEIPSHSHPQTKPNIIQNTATGSTQFGYLSNGSFNNSGSVGGGQAHNNLQPYIVVNYIIKAKQSAGLVATVVDSLTSSSTTDALSANQGKSLNTTINNILSGIEGTTIPIAWSNGITAISGAENSIRVNTTEKSCLLTFAVDRSSAIESAFVIGTFSTDYAPTNLVMAAAITSVTPATTYGCQVSVDSSGNININNRGHSASTFRGQIKWFYE